MKTVTFKIDEQMHADAKSLAAQRFVFLADIMNDAVRIGLASMRSARSAAHEADQSRETSPAGEGAK